MRAVGLSSLTLRAATSASSASTLTWSALRLRVMPTVYCCFIALISLSSGRHKRVDAEMIARLGAAALTDRVRALADARAHRAAPERAAHRLRIGAEHDIEADGDALEFVRICRHPMREPGGKQHEAAGPDLDADLVTDEFAVLLGARQHGHRLRPRIVEDDAVGTGRNLHVVDAGEEVVRVGVARVETALRIDVDPAAGDLERAVLDLQKLERALGAGADDRRDLGELRQPVDVGVGLPGLARLDRRPGGRQYLDRFDDLQIERPVNVGPEIDDPDGRRK